MKLPRNISGAKLIKLLNKYGYVVTKQKGIHIRLTRQMLNTSGLNYKERPFFKYRNWYILKHLKSYRNIF